MTTASRPIRHELAELRHRHDTLTPRERGEVGSQPHAVTGYVETVEVAWRLGDHECLS